MFFLGVSNWYYIDLSLVALKAPNSASPCYSSAASSCKWNPLLVRCCSKFSHIGRPLRYYTTTSTNMKTMWRKYIIIFQPNLTDVTVPTWPCRLTLSGNWKWEEMEDFGCRGFKSRLGIFFHFFSSFFQLSILFFMRN